jgi:uncharacterized protein
MDKTKNTRKIMQNQNSKKKNKCSYIMLIFIILLVSNHNLVQAQDSREVEIKYHEKIEMRDGIRLSATIVKPRIIEKVGIPVLLVLSPYIADRNHAWALYFARNNYAVVSVDTRGRGNSEGVCQPFDTIDGIDGYDVCKWILDQSWCNGKIGMYGGSYLGMVQWQVLRNAAPGLQSIVPTASVCPGIDFPKRNNIFYNYLGPYFTFISAKTSNHYSFTHTEFWKQQYKKLFYGQVPYADMMSLAGIDLDYFEEWLAHPGYDDFWKRRIPDAAEYRKMDIPILTITGYYDDDQHGAMHYYREHLKNCRPAAAKKHYLVMGPWDHSGTRSPQLQLGELTFASQALVDMKKLHLEWFDWTLKGKEKPALLKGRVNYYLMGEEGWYHKESIGELSNSGIILYLDSENGQAQDLFHSGYLRKEVPGKSAPDQYIYDPLDDDFLDYDLEDGHLLNYSLYKERDAHKKPAFVYHSEKFTRDLIFSGQIRLKIFLEMDVSDADFEILLYEICEDGTAIFLTMDILRSRYRNSLEKEILVEKGQILEYEFNTAYMFIRKIRQNSRLRLIIRNLNSPHYQKNFQSGTDVSRETKTSAQKSKVTLYHDNKYRSFLEIPVLN